MAPLHREVPVTASKRHLVSATLNGKSLAEEKLEVGSGRKTTVELLPGKQETTLGEGALEAGGGRKTTVEQQDHTEKPWSDEQTGTLKKLAWGLGGAVVLGGTSSVLFYFRRQAIDEFNREDRLYLDPESADRSKHDKARDKAESKAKLFHGFAIATAVTAGICAVGTLTAVIIADSMGKKKSKSQTEIQVGVFSLGVTY